MTLAELLAAGLGQAGAGRLFTSADRPALTPLVDAARARRLTVISVQSPWAAGVAGAITGTLTGVPGVVVLAAGTSEPGVADAIAFARRNRAPLLVLTPAPAGRAPGVVEGRRPEAVSPELESTSPSVDTGGEKQRLRATPESAGRWIAHAARLALSDPRGPVQLEVVAGALGRWDLPLTAIPQVSCVPAPSAEQLEAVARAIRQASRPLVLAGRGCRAADTPWVRAFMESMPAPVVTTPTARGVVPEPHPLALGALLGGGALDEALARADLLITVGVDRDELAGRELPGPVAHVDLARAAGDGPGSPGVRVAGEPGAIFAELAGGLAGRSLADWDVAELDRIKRRLRAPAASAAARVVALAREMTPAGTIAAFDGGAAWPAQRGWQAVELGDSLVLLDAGTRGVAVPAALAAALVFPARRILAFTDPAGLAVVAGELATAAELDLRITVVVLATGEDSATLEAARQSGWLATEAPDAPSSPRALSTALASPHPSIVVVRGAAGGEPSP